VLTSDLLRVRRKDGVLEPRFLAAAARKRLLPAARDLVAALQHGEGSTREQLDELLDAIPFKPSDRQVVQGLRKLLLDRCEFEVDEGVEPRVIRKALFDAAASHRKALGPREHFERATIVERVATELKLDPEVVERRMFADLRSHERLTRFRTIDAEALLDRYDLALAQGVLLRATRVRILLEGEDAGRARQLFRAARFHGLLHRVTRRGEGSYVIDLDGPFSLFSAVQRYGLKLAMFLPAVLRCEHWRLSAEVLWGKAREPLRFHLGPERGLVPHDRRITGVAPELQTFCERFDKLDTAWKLARNDHIIALPGESVCVPDLLFCHGETGEEVFLEAFGFWSRAAVFQRIETILRGDFPARLILAVGKQLRVSEELLEDEHSGVLHVYSTSMSPKKVLALLDADGGAARDAAPRDAERAT
jgi:predicted nuclease of restriction endonuclease-like RecB superfamily